MDLSLLLLTTPTMPPTGPAPGVPIADVPPWPGCWALPNVAAAADPANGPGADPGVPNPGVAVPGPPRPAVPAWFAVTGWKSSFVIGSLNFLRRKRCCTRMSRLGGWVFANLRPYNWM